MIRIIKRFHHSLNLGIRKETKNIWERRAPLTPDAVSQILKETKGKVYIQPSTKRVFSDEEYESAGATITESLDKADLILGVKEVPEWDLLPNKSYMFFSHTHKGQPHNMAMLKTILDRKIRLIDYELLVDPKSKKRLVLFSKFAGFAGVIDALHGIGLKYLALGFDTPFLFVNQTFSYPSLGAAKTFLKTTVSEQIKTKKFHSGLGPVVFALTGSGNVSQGAKEIIDCLPVEWISVSELPGLSSNYKRDRIYAVQVNAKDYIEPKNKSVKFSTSSYYSSPELYKSAFHTKIAPYVHMIINGIYWEAKYPRLLTKSQLKDISVTQKGKLPLPVHLADISCDINGPFEFMSHASTISEPFFCYDPITDSENVSLEAPGIQIMSIDNLPTQLPLEATRHFSSQLYPHIVNFLQKKADSNEILKEATITLPSGTLSNSSRFAHLVPLVKNTGNATVSSPKSVLLLGSGYVSAPIIDYFAKKNIAVTVATNNDLEGKRLVSNRPNATLQPLDVSSSHGLQELVRASNVVISMLPATLHPTVAGCCISQKKSLVTASYISPDMLKLDQAAREAGTLLLNELGLDPGIDHLTAKRIIDSIQANGDAVVSFVSWCGGLPAPEASHNPLRYKFSWSPRGVLSASGNGAIWLENGKLSRIDQGKLMQVKPIAFNNYPGFQLEGYPNRDSTHYIDAYGLASPYLQKMFRGTLRYSGYCRLMDCFQRLRLTSSSAPAAFVKSWPEAVLSLSGGTGQDLKQQLAKLLAKVGISETELANLEEVMEYFGLFDVAHLYPTGKNGEKLCAIDAFTKVLEKKCAYKPAVLSTKTPGERDLVILHHEIIARQSKTGQLEKHTSALVAYGSPWSFSKSENGIITPIGEYTAMAKTVGLPAAIGANLILQNHFTPSKPQFTGVKAPLEKCYYEPILENLQKQDIHFEESVSRMSSKKQ